MRKSLAESLREEQPLGMAAAGAAVDSVALMNRLFRESELSREELAEQIGITLDRVNEVLDGDGNVRVSTLARFVRACGHDLVIESQEHDIQ